LIVTRCVDGRECPQKVSLSWVTKLHAFSLVQGDYNGLILRGPCPMLGGANGFSFRFYFLYCTDLCLIEGAQGNYKFIIIIPRPKNESLLGPSTFQCHQSIELSSLITWLERLTETFVCSSCLDRT
jgi:hypothetical protein